MKFRIIEVLSNLFESRISDAHAKYPHFSKETMKDLSDGDPSGNNKYIMWMAKQVDSGAPWLNMKDALRYFHKFQNAFKVKSIFEYETAESLIQAVDKRKEIKQAKDEKVSMGKDREVIYNGEDYLVVLPKSHEASMKYGQGTKWCITNKSDSYWNQYSSKGIFYFIMNKQLLEMVNGRPDNYKLALLIDFLEDTFEVFDAKDMNKIRGSELVDGEKFGAPMFAKDGIHLKRADALKFEEMGVSREILKIILDHYKHFKLEKIRDLYENNEHIPVLIEYLKENKNIEVEKSDIKLSERYRNPQGFTVDGQFRGPNQPQLINYVIVDEGEFEEQEQQQHEMHRDMLYDEWQEYVTKDNFEHYINERTFDEYIEEYFSEYYEEESYYVDIAEEMKDDWYRSNYPNWEDPGDREFETSAEEEEAENEADALALEFENFVRGTIEDHMKNAIHDAQRDYPEFVEEHMHGEVPYDYIDRDAWIDDYMNGWEPDEFGDESFEIPYGSRDSFTYGPDKLNYIIFSDK